MLQILYHCLRGAKAYVHFHWQRANGLMSVLAHNILNLCSVLCISDTEPILVLVYTSFAACPLCHCYPWCSINGTVCQWISAGCCPAPTNWMTALWSCSDGFTTFRMYCNVVHCSCLSSRLCCFTQVSASVVTESRMQLLQMGFCCMYYMYDNSPHSALIHYH